VWNSTNCVNPKEHAAARNEKRLKRLSELTRPEQPIVVFVSSAQQEFRKFRQDLKYAIDTEAWSGLNVMRARLIENQRGPIIASEIRKALDETSIYVGIFGRQLRDWPVAEFRYAKARGLPQLIYRYERRLRPGRPRICKRGRIGAVDRFLKEEVVSAGIRVNGPYRSLENLLEIIPEDLANLVSVMVRENADIRKMMCTGMPGMS